MYLWVKWDGAAKNYSIAPAPDWQERADKERFDIRRHRGRIESMCKTVLGDNFLGLYLGGNVQELLLRVKVGTSSEEKTRMVFTDLKGWISLLLMNN